MAQGLIAAAIGGFGKALSSIGEMEAKKQNEAKLRKEIMDMESEERLRLDEVMHERKLKRLPEEAIAQAKANVGAESTTLDESTRLNLPERKAVAAATSEKLGYAAKTNAGVPAAAATYEATTASEKLKARENLGVVEAEAREDVRKDVAKLVAENGSEKAKLLAQQKVNGRLAELAAIKDNKLDEAESRAKYNALMTDIKIAKELGVDVAEMERAAERENARISALIKNRVPAKEAQLANERRLETVRAQLDSTIITEEANLLAKQEMAKIQAMTQQGVPEAEAKLLAAKWKAGKTQRDEAAAEKTQQEITDAITRAGNKKYLSAERSIAATKHFASGDGTTKGEKVTTADLHRKLEAAEDDLADALGVPKNNVNEKLASLRKKADSGDTKAKQTLEDIQTLRDNVKKRRADLQNWRDKPEEDKDKNASSTATPKKGDTRIIAAGVNKGKTAVYDGQGWVLKQ